MSAWGIETFGAPCRECSYRWPDTTQAVQLIASAPGAYRELLSEATGRERAPDLDWNASAYVAHVVDNLRVWAERLAAAAAGDDSPIVGYDDVALSTARRYERLPLPGSLWSLERSVEAWLDAFNGADHVVLAHPTRGTISAGDVASTNAHDTSHHYFDIGRCLGDAQGRPLPTPMPGSA